jgi:hypothetical protein
MHASITAEILRDPVVVFELCTLFFAFCFVVKAAGFTELYSARTGVPDRSKRSSIEERLFTLFSVGTLISLPKQSLNGQRAYK